MNSSLGLHLGTFGVSQLGLNPARRPRRSAVMGLEAGIGMVRYYQPSLTVIPTSLGLKIFFSRIDNSLYLAAGGHGSILVRATLKTPKASILVWATNSFCSILNVSLLNFSMNNDSLI